MNMITNELIGRCHEKTIFNDDTVKITTAYLPTVDEMAIIIYEMNAAGDCWAIVKNIRLSDILK